MPRKGVSKRRGEQVFLDPRKLFLRNASNYTIREIVCLENLALYSSKSHHLILIPTIFTHCASMQNWSFSSYLFVYIVLHTVHIGPKSAILANSPFFAKNCTMYYRMYYMYVRTYVCFTL